VRVLDTVKCAHLRTLVVKDKCCIGDEL